ncbi:MAG: hypothetical protein M0Z77_11225 [Thermoplasmatales archaeon]|nr:hypothetical protein [Thermoplasmatales archaeon]
MRNDLFSREFGKLVEGRMKKLSGLNLEEELQAKENVSIIPGQDCEEVFRE